MYIDLIYMNVFIGATLGKGLNRTIATLAAGALGVGAHYLASLSGATGEPILIGAFVFVQGKNKSYIYQINKVNNILKKRPRE